MFNARNILRVRIVLTMAAALLVGVAAIAQPLAPVSRGPLARLVRTPEDSAGFPPYALADQTGTIQRYVEPVPGIDLDPYVNQIVTVRHDTGETLLASQLDLPQQALYPMVGESFGKSPAGGRMSADRSVQQAEFVDNDDTTVELVEDGEAVPSGSGPVLQGVVPEGAIYPDGSPVYPGPMSPGMPMMGAGPMYGDPMQYGPTMEAYPGDYGVGPWPQYGQYQGAPPYGQNMGFVQPYGGKPQRERPHVFADVEINFLRAHVVEDMFGKLSEKYEFSPRFIVGFTDVGNLSGRIRYWVYGRGTNGLSDEDDIHIDFDVWDLEATHLFEGRRSQLEVAAGFRLAGIEIEDDEDAAFGSDLIGITMAADGWTPLFTCDHGCFGWTYGGRLSILAGDWAGDDDNEFINSRIRDDNVVVHELYAGLGYSRRLRSIDVNASLDFEMQNWHSDVLAEATDDGTVGFVGPGIRLGAEF
ncbi:MAG: hypothetical protein L0228_05865 [Planctomycetes bacterium]|nr:hypothetical protein [Planctomycetota bacterium]